MINSPDLDRLRADVKEALKKQAEALTAHDAAVLKLQEKKLEHDGLYTQLENLRQEASAKDGVDQKAIAALSNIRETVEISERQLKRLTEEVSVAGEQLSECWQHDTIPRVRALHDNIKAQLTHEGKQLIDANFVKNPHIWADQAVRSSYNDSAHRK